MAEINIPGFQASQIFVTMQDALKSQGSTLSQSAKGIFQFDIKSKDNKIQTWYADLKGPAFRVTTGAAPGKPDVTMTLSDEDLMDLASGKITGQKAFMAGKLKLKGNMMLATKLDPVFKAIGPKANGPKAKL